MLSEINQKTPLSQYQRKKLKINLILKITFDEFNVFCFTQLKDMDESKFRLYFFKYAFFSFAFVVFVVVTPWLFARFISSTFIIIYFFGIIYLLIGVFLIYRHSRIGTIIYAIVSAVLDIIVIIVAVIYGVRDRDIAPEEISLNLIVTVPLTVVVPLASIVGFELHRAERIAFSGNGEQVLLANTV